jgi:hypothetical protein
MNQAAGNILNDDADTIGQLVEGDPKELMGKTLNVSFHMKLGYSMVLPRVDSR